jgi:hypothetical protein
MTDPTPTPTPTPTPQPAAKTRKYGIVDKRQEQSVAQAEKVVTAASKDEYATVLETEHEITPDFIAQLGADTGTARGSLGQIVQNAVAGNVATGGKSGTQKTLMQSIRKIQAAARQKYAGSQPLLLKDYFIGQKIDATQFTPEEIGTAILNRISPPDDSTTPADVLPGIKAPKIAALSSALAAYTTAWSAQASAQSDKVKGHFALGVLVKSINVRRRLVQYAVDGEWPYDDAANAPIRREFGIPPNRPFVAVVKNAQTPAATSPTPPASAKRKAARAKKIAKVKKAVKAVKARKPAKKRKK